MFNITKGCFSLHLILFSEKPWFHSGSQSVCYNLSFSLPCCLSPCEAPIFFLPFIIFLFLSCFLSSLRIWPRLLHIKLFICFLFAWGPRVWRCTCLGVCADRNGRAGARYKRSKNKDDVVMGLQLMNLHTVIGNVWQAKCCSQMGTSLTSDKWIDHRSRERRRRRKRERDWPERKQTILPLNFTDTHLETFSYERAQRKRD